MRRRFVGVAVALVVVVVAVTTLVGVLVGSVLGRGSDSRVWPMVVGAGVLVALLVAATRLTLRWARPVSAVIEAADRVADGDLGARAPAAGPGAVRRLSWSFNTMATRLQEDDARRRALLADVAHELRTPMSVVRGNLEGMLDGVYEPDAGRIERLLG